jgi:hypothetical protein
VEFKDLNWLEKEGGSQAELFTQSKLLHEAYNIIK